MAVIHTIQPYDDGQLIWQIAGNDRAGNELEKDPTLLSVQSLNFGQYIENSESFSFEADTRSPKLIGIKFQETNALKNSKYGDNSTRILSSGDNLSLTFDLDEAIDPPNVVLQIGTHFIPDVIATSDNGTNWTVSYQLGSQDEGLLNWAISGKDRAGNFLELDTPGSQGGGGGSSLFVSSLDFDEYNNKKYEVDITLQKSIVWFLKL